MLLSNAVVAASFLIALINTTSAAPHPGTYIRERHVILTPIKVKYIHHYKVKKVPIVIRKHLHYYKEDKEEIHRHHSKNPIETLYQHTKPGLPEDYHTNQVDHDEDDEQYPPHFEGSSHGSSYESHQEEEEYEEPEQWKEEDEYEDYEYE